MAGYEDTNDAVRLAEDPTFRMLASREQREMSVALTSTLHWFEAEVLAEDRKYQLAESHLTSRFYGQILMRIERLAGHPT